MQLLQLPSFGNTVAANATASLVTQKTDGKSIHAVHCDIGGGNNRANMNRFQLRYAERDIINLPAHPTGPIAAGTMLNSLNVYRGVNIFTAEAAGYFRIFLGNPECDGYRDQHLGDLDCSVHRGADGKAANFEIQVDLGAGVAPTMTAFAEVGPPKAAMGFHPEDQLVHKLYMRNYFAPAAALTRNEQQLAIGAAFRSNICRILHWNAQLTSLEVVKDDVKLWQDIVGADANALQAAFGHLAVAGIYVWDPIMHGKMLELVSTLKDDGQRKNAATFQFLYTFAAADTVTALAEVIGDQYSSTAPTAAAR